MQKSSTMGLRGSRIFKGGQLTIGMDLGHRSSCYCVLDEPNGSRMRRNRMGRILGSTLHFTLKLKALLCFRY